MNARDMALALLVMAIWGTNFVATKIGMRVFEPMFLLTVRFALVAALLAPFMKRVTWREAKWIALLSVILGSLHFPLIFHGIRGVDAAVGAIVAQLQVPFSSLLAAWLFKDHLGWRRAAGMALAFGGIAIIAGEPRNHSDWLNLLAIVGASFAFAVSNLVIKRIGPVDGLTLNGWMALFALPQVLVLSLIFEDGQLASLTAASLDHWLALGYIAVASSIIAYGLWYRLARVHPVNQTMPFLLLIPVFGVIAGVVMLGEPMTWGLVVGGAMTIAGIAIIMIRRPRTVDPKSGTIT